MSDAELRYQILTDTREHLMTHWEQKVRVEGQVAEFEERKPRVINPPTISRIVRTASAFLDFVNPPEQPDANPDTSDQEG
jgi:hypothetical protein